MRKSDIQEEFLGYGVLYLAYLDRRKREATEAIAKLRRDEIKATKKADKAAGKAAKKARKRPVDDIMTDDDVSSNAENGDASIPFDPDEMDDDDPDTPPEQRIEGEEYDDVDAFVRGME